MFSKADVIHLVQVASDHCPFLVLLHGSNDSPTNSGFKF